MTYFDVSVYEPVKFDVIVIFTEGSDQDFCNLQPTDVEAEL